jgi:hypothetical protein
MFTFTRYQQFWADLPKSAVASTRAVGRWIPGVVGVFTGTDLGSLDEKCRVQVNERAMALLTCWSKHASATEPAT